MKSVISPAKRFAPAKSFFHPLIFQVVCFTLVLIISFWGKGNGLRGFTPISLSILWLLSVSYFVWTWTNIRYELKDGQLFYRSGFTKGSVQVSSIRKIETNVRGWGNNRAALAYKGMMITYNKWDEVFIAPKDQEGFLKELLQINPEIDVIISKR